MGLKTCFCCALVAAALIIWSPFDTEWYNSLKKPQLTPPHWVFPIIWLVFYGFLGVTGFMLNIETSSKKRLIARYLFNIHIIVNGLWSFLFFKKHQLGYSLIDTGVMIITALGCLLLVPSIRVLVVPYLFWLLYAGYLNYEIYSLNRN
jgi:translocator protein